MAKQMQFVEAWERVYVRDGGYETRAVVRGGAGGVCVRSVTVNMPDETIVQHLNGDAMINDLVGLTVGELEARGLVYRREQPYYIGDDGEDYDRTVDGGYIRDVATDDDVYQVVYDADGVEC